MGARRPRDRQPLLSTRNHVSSSDPSRARDDHEPSDQDRTSRSRGPATSVSPSPSRSSSRSSTLSSSPDYAYRIFFLGCAGATFSAAYEATQAAIQLPTIATDLHVQKSSSWVASAYLLFSLIGMACLAQLSDISGRKPVLICSCLFFVIGSILCSVAPSLPWLTLARAVTGLGAGSTYLLASTSITEMVSSRDRSVWLSLLNAAPMAGAGFGVPLAGFLLDAIGWRWSFALPAVPCIFCIVTTCYITSHRGDHLQTFASGLKQANWLGTALFAFAAIACLFVLEFASNLSWRSWQALLATALAIVLAVSFLLVERFVVARPLLPRFVVFDRNLMPICLAGFFQQAAWIGFYYQVVLYLEVVSVLAPRQISVTLIPLPVSNILGNLLAGVCIKWMNKRFARLTIVSLFACVFCDVCVAVSAVYRSAIGVIISIIASNLFSGSAVNTLISGVVFHSPTETIGSSTAVYLFMRAVGSVVGVPLSTAIFNFTLRLVLAKAVDHDTAERVRDSIDFTGLAPEIVAKVRGCYQSSLVVSLSLNVGLIVLALFSSFFICDATKSTRRVRTDITTDTGISNTA